MGSTSNKECNEFCYNERRYFEYEADPKDYFEYVKSRIPKKTKPKLKRITTHILGNTMC